MKLSFITKSILTKKTLKLVIGVLVLVAIINFRIENIPQYQTDNPKIANITETVDFTDRIYPIQYAKVTLPNNDKIKAVLVKPWEKVKKGQTIVQLDDTQAKQNYHTAWVNYNNAIIARNKLNDLTKNQKQDNKTIEEINNLADSIINDPNASEAIKKLALTLKEYANSITNLNSALGSQLSNSSISPQSAVNLAYANLQQAKKQLEDTKIKSPINGKVYVIVRNNYDTGSNSGTDISGMSSGIPNLSLGSISSLSGLSMGNISSSSEFVPANQNVIYIVNDAGWRIYAKLPQADVIKVHLNQTVKIHIKSTEKYLTGKITFIYRVPNNLYGEDAQYFVQINIDPKSVKDTKIFPGFLIEGEIALQENKDVLTIPLDAIYYDDNDNPYVFKIVNNAKVKQTVTLGLQSQDRVEVQTGLTEDDTILIRELKPLKKLRWNRFINLHR